MSKTSKTLIVVVALVAAAAGLIAAAQAVRPPGVPIVAAPYPEAEEARREIVELLRRTKCQLQVEVRVTPDGQSVPRILVEPILIARGTAAESPAP